MLVFWAMLCLTWLFGGLHMAFSQLWMLIVFVILNIVQVSSPGGIGAVLEDLRPAGSRGTFVFCNRLPCSCL